MISPPKWRIDVHNVSPTLSLAMTQAGMILGAAAYMSPEEARGRPVDQRADIREFGVILAEMLTRRIVYSGETVYHTLAAEQTLFVRVSRPNWRADGFPKTPRRSLGRCVFVHSRSRW